VIRGEYDIDTFGQLIADRVRTGAYAEALRRVVRPESIVLDIGTGTGILALLACRFGARRVHAVEADPIIATAREIAVANGCADRIVFHEAMSTELDLPERADVIVSDIYGILPLHRSRIPVLADARERLLAPDGVMIPRRDHLWLAAVCAPGAHRVVSEPWIANEYGFDMTAARDIAANQCRRVVLEAGDLVTDPVACGTLDYATVTDPSFHVKAGARVNRAGPVHGFCMWFDAELVDGVGFSNAPGRPHVIYGNAFFAWPEPVEARAGDEVRLDVRARLAGGRYVWAWDSAMRVAGDPSTGRAEFRQSTFLGMPLASGGLRAVAAEHAPGLGEEGRVDRSVLEAMAGGASLEIIARRLQAEHPARFRHYEDALAHAGALSVRYGR
jgi:protein arginine N-methyltransferase 1